MWTMSCRCVRSWNSDCDRLSFLEPSGDKFTPTLGQSPMVNAQNLFPMQNYHSDPFPYIRLSLALLWVALVYVLYRWSFLVLKKGSFVGVTAVWSHNRLVHVLIYTVSGRKLCQFNLLISTGRVGFPSSLARLGY